MFAMVSAMMGGWDGGTDVDDDWVPTDGRAAADDWTNVVTGIRLDEAVLF